MYFAEYLPRVGKVNITTSEEITSLTTNSITLSNGEGFCLPHEILLDDIVTEKNETGVTSIRCRSLGGRRLLASKNVLYSRKKWESDFFQANKNKVSTLFCSCGKPVIELNNYSYIADMPSEYWHELMDLWHCHKPTVVSADASKQSSRSPLYTSEFNTELVPRENELLIGDSYFCLKMPDETVANLGGEAHCAGCLKTLGKYNQKHHYYQLYKWQLRFSAHKKLLDDIYHPRDFITQSLINSIDSLGVRIYEICSFSAQAITVWCFDLGVDIGLSDGTIEKNAMKILYKKGKPSLKNKQNVETLSVPQECFDDFFSRIESVHATIQTKFDGEWNVSYI